MESVSPSGECMSYYVAEAQRTIDIADDESFIACLSALFILLPKVTKWVTKISMQTVYAVFLL